MNIGERIRQRRTELNMTQDEIAKKTGYKSRSSINKIECSRSLPLSKVERMAEALDCTPAYLMGWEDGEFERKIQKSHIQVVPKPDCKINFDKLQVAIEKCSANKLNEKGTEELVKFIIDRMMEHSEMLSKIPEYQSVPLLNAAHADDYATAPEELKKQEEDIMDDDNF